MSDEHDKFKTGDSDDGEDAKITASPRHPVAPSPRPPVPASHHHGHLHIPLYGIMAEFEGPNELVHAARQVYEAGYRRINGYSPYPIEELSEAIGFTHTSLPVIVFIGGLVGGIGG
ncbi:MAG TPA: quinol:electron acceptor oxidoreductase subunit ActD, partial [Pyrinomonadaceae bacterium]|nr:quinol:electron acceptor oxidoreductase subunit ActD [Pyrinomonadaceae bacterium]